MSELEALTAPAAPAQVIADVALEQRRSWIASVLGAREALWLDGSEDPLAALRRALDSDRLPAAVAWTAGFERVTSFEAVADLLDEFSDRGAALVVALPNTRLDASFGEQRALTVGWDEARELAARLGAEVFEQRYAEAALIGEPGENPLTGTLVGAAAGEPDDACAWLLVAGLPGAAADARLKFSAQPVHRSYLAALQAANDELLRANARLARANLGRHDAGAASVIGRIEREYGEQLAEARGEVARLEARLQVEIEVAAQNDRFFQDTRATLQRPEHRAVTALVARVLRVPGGRLVLRLVRRFLSR